MAFQKILVMSTVRNGLRSEAEGWGFEDSSNIQPSQSQHPHIGLASINRSIAGREEFYCYDCPVRAMANGWRLMAPPSEIKWKTSDGEELIRYEWWFEKVVP